MYQNNYNMARGRGGFRGNRGGRGRGSFRGGPPFPPWGNNRGGGHKFQHQGNSNQQWKNNKPRDTPGKRLSEEEIGVTEYVCKDFSFNGIIKHRFADFQVSEINEQGEVAKLTDLTVPQPIEEEIEDGEEFLLNKYNLEILPIETWDKINALVVSDSTDDIEVDVTGKAKEERTKIHESVKKAFGAGIVGSTVSRDDKKYVVFKKYRTGIRIDKRIKWAWPADFVHFIVYKENCDTMEAVTQIAQRLDAFYIKPSLIGYAGTKDRRAKTTQWFSLRRIQPMKIARACRDLRDIKAGNFKFVDKHLKLGDLKGNRFRIALRNVTSEDDAINAACNHLKEKGFINYYGLQRFGTRHSTPTFAIGLHLYQKDFKKAIHAILEEREGSLQEALVTYKKSGDADFACKFIRKFDLNTTEAKILKFLAMAPNDYCGAMNKVARNIRLLYLHSYQSLVWNRCVSERLKRYSHTPVVGDLIVQQSDKLKLELEDNELDIDEEESNEADEIDEANPERKPETNTETIDTKSNDNDTFKFNTSKERRHIPVKVLTQEDIDSGTYTMFDVVMPLPGFDIQYPGHMKEFYEELLKKDNVNLNVKDKFKSYNVAGAYRYVLAKPFDMEWQTVRYTNPYGDLILSDLDELQNKTNKTIVPDGKFKALLLSMSLTTSCYATMALRELLKSDTSGDHQASQNNYFRDKTDANTKKTIEKRKVEEKNGSDSKKTKVETDGNSDEVAENVKEDCKEINNDNKEGAEKRKIDTEGILESKKSKVQSEEGGSEENPQIDEKEVIECNKLNALVDDIIQDTMN